MTSPLLLFAQLWESRTINALCAQNIDVVEFGKLFRCECFCWTKDHMSGIMDHNIQPPVVGDDLLDRRIH